MRYAQPRTFALILVSMTILLAACQGRLATSPTASAALPSASASPTTAPSASATDTPSAAASASEAASASPAASAPAGAPFACEPLEIRDQADQTHALIADVRVGTHEGYDRLVVEFTPAMEAPPGVPEYIIRVAEQPLTQDPSDQPMEVPGSHHLLLALLGGTKYDENYNLRYTGPTQFDPAFPALVAVYERGDFEATSSWYIGLDQEPCLRVFTLTDPMRLVIDIAH